ncbi:nicotinamide N-methyltransferase-like protein Nnt1 [Acrodontium crateriforme]|uniref:Protein N-terminal and lysine N-methyltransferase EFM7 n=1 Tax=Acrodontium crateriforme TaxID=150365 RepID=A0AAQ3M8X1_9PEZI|nr:nicotinamide N-methyltransferase-like protein Nnt1 [Acrodontium crateriforme]
MSNSSDDEDETGGLFQEPEGFYEPEKEPTFVHHRMINGDQLTMRLVGHNPLWGHLLWNAGRTLADYFETNATTLIKDKTVLELGAGAGLPSLMSAIHGAKQVVVTDYPDADLIENLTYNIQHCPHLPQSGEKNIVAEGFLWGASPTPLTAHLPPNEDSGFDLLILADLLFNHSEHTKLLATVQQTLSHSPSAQALVFFTPYRPWLLQKDLAFFDLAREGGFEVEKIMEKVMDKVMFEEDPGDELLRRTVFGYRLRRII